MVVSGIYRIRNKITGKCYVGSSVDVHHRWKHHINFLNKNKHDNKHLQHAWNKYGESCFEFEISEQVSIDELIYSEQRILDVCKSCPDYYYNLSYDSFAPMRGKIPWNKGKTGLHPSWNKGIPFSTDTKKKMSIAGKQRIGSKNSMFGKNHSESTRLKMKISRRNRKPISEETRQKMSISQKKRFE
jgi:group I intron endonuclease